MSYQSKVTEAQQQGCARRRAPIGALSPLVNVLHSHLAGTRFRFGHALVAIAAVGCNGIVEAPPRATLTHGASQTAASSSGIQASAPTVELPSDYQAWPAFMMGVERTDNGQVRDLYVNEIGTTVQEGQPFPAGTLLVMDLFAAQKDGTGALARDGNGHLMRGALMKTFVMGKDSGWGNYVSPDLRNGDWLYSAYGPDGKTPTADPLPPCFSCHYSLGASQDWVQRYGEYFTERAARKP